jgi:nucleotide-binding universal stress UspA family protein
MRQAADIVREAHGTLTLAHVVHVPIAAFAEGAPMLPSSGFAMEREMTEQGEKLIAEWKRRAEEMGVREVTTTLLAGVPWHEIVELLRKDPSYDLVVLGTEGKTGVSHVLLGSVAERVVRHAPCPVLVVRGRPRP